MPRAKGAVAANNAIELKIVPSFRMSPIPPILSACEMGAEYKPRPHNTHCLLLTLLLNFWIRMRDLFEHGFFVEALERRAVAVVALRALLCSRVNQASSDGVCTVFHDALLHEGLAGTVARFAHDAVFDFDLLRGNRLGEIVRCGMALETLAALLWILNANFLTSFLGLVGAENLESLGVWAGLPLGELIAGFFFFVAHAAHLHADIIGSVRRGGNVADCQ